MKNRDKKSSPFLEKFMVSSDDYTIFKFGGSSLKNEEYGIKTMMQYFPDYFTEGELKQNLERYNLHNKRGRIHIYDK